MNQEIIPKRTLFSTNAFNSIYQSIITISLPEMVIHQVNNSVIEFLGYDPDELLTQKFRIFFHSDQSYQEFSEQLRKAFFDKRNFLPVSFKLKKKDGGEVLCDAYFSLLHKVEGTKHALAYLRDIIEKKQHLSEPQFAAGLEEEYTSFSSPFLQNLWHEIRTPMNGIIGFIQLLMTDTHDSDTVIQYLDIIAKSKNRLLNLIDNLVLLSKMEAGFVKGECKIFVANDLLVELCNLFSPQASAKGLHFELVNDNLPPDYAIFSDRDKVFQLLFNLISNAIKFTLAGSVTIGSSIKNGVVTFRVNDTGIGIPFEKQSFIFDAFVQVDTSINRNYEGAGLGLPISKLLVEILGGKIWLESTCGKGTTFFVSLPPSSPNGTDTNITNNIMINDEFPLNSSLKILIAEDDSASAILVETFLKPLSSEIFKASNGYEAIKICQENPDCDLILMDIRMPIVDGLSATSQIRCFNTNVVIIAQSASAYPDDKLKAIEIGCNDYITKPIDRFELFHLVHKHLKRN